MLCSRHIGILTRGWIELELGGEVVGAMGRGGNGVEIENLSHMPFKPAQRARKGLLFGELRIVLM